MIEEFSKRRSTVHQSAHVDQSRHPAIFRVMSFNKTKNVVQDSPLSGAQIDGRIPMRRIVVIADLIGDGHDMLTNAKAHRHPVGGTTDADLDRKSAVWGKGVSVRVALGGRRIIKKKIIK